MTSNSLDFQRLYTEYQARMLRYLTLLADDVVAQDLCQKIFIMGNRGLRDFLGDEQHSNWVCRVATNTYHDRLRSRA